MRINLLLFLAFFVAIAPAQGWEAVLFVRDLDVEPQQIRAVPARRIPESFMPMPDYPETMLQSGISGETALRFFVNSDGAVRDVSVLETSRSEFAEAAKAAVGRWRYSPEPHGFGGMIYDATNVWMRCRLVFRIENDTDLPSRYPAFAETRKSAREVFALIPDAAKKAGINLRQYSRDPQPQVHVSGAIWHLRWFQAEAEGGGVLGFWLDERTGESHFEKEDFMKGPLSPFPQPAGLAMAGSENDLVFVMQFSGADPTRADAPSVVSLQFPSFPSEMLPRHAAGGSSLNFLIKEDGSASDVRVGTESHPSFGQAAMEAVVATRFARSSASLGRSGVAPAMQVRFIFDYDHHTDVDFFGPVFPETTLSGYDVFRLAHTRIAKEQPVRASAPPDTVRVAKINGRIRWIFSWLGTEGWPKSDQVSVDDQSRESSFEVNVAPDR